MFARSLSLAPFPMYLLPPTPLRRQKKNPGSSDSGILSDYSTGHAKKYLSNHASYLRCIKCANDICLTSQIISKGFTGRHGRAYLVSPYPLPVRSVQTATSIQNSYLPNTSTDAPSSRQLVTGAHTVSDVRCSFCNSLLGWKYEEAEEESQRYKVGKYILETKMICSSSHWEPGESKVPSGSPPDRSKGDGVVEFDSEDEEECEDLFAGVWNPLLATRRRQGRSFRGVGGATFEGTGAQ